MQKPPEIQGECGLGGTSRASPCWWQRGLQRVWMGKTPRHPMSYLFSGASWWRSKVLPASRRQLVRSRIVWFCWQDAGSTLNDIW